MAHAASRRILAAKQEAAVRAKVGELMGKAKFALDEGRADLAEALVSRQLDFEKQIPELGALQKDATEQENTLRRTIAELETRKREMDADLAAIGAWTEQAEASEAQSLLVADLFPTSGEAASRAFERAKSAYGGVATLPTATPDTIAKLAEFETLSRTQEIADRLARLREEEASSPESLAG